MPSITFTNLTRAIEIGANCYALEIGDRRLVLDSGLHPKLDGEPALPDFRLIEDDSVEAIIDRVVTHARPGDTIAIMSNGAFGSIHPKLLAALAMGTRAHHPTI